MARSKCCLIELYGLARCRRAADAPSVADFAKVSGCLYVVKHRQPEKVKLLGVAPNGSYWMDGFQAAFNVAKHRQPETFAKRQWQPEI